MSRGALQLRRLLLLRCISSSSSSFSASQLHHNFFDLPSRSFSSSSPSPSKSSEEAVAVRKVEIGLEYGNTELLKDPEFLRFQQVVNNRYGRRSYSGPKRDSTFSYIIDFFGQRKDFKAVHDFLVRGRGDTGPKTLATSIDHLVRAGQATQAETFFEKMEQVYGFVRDRESFNIVVSALCEHGFASHAEKMVKNLAHEFIPDETACDLLIKAWCVNGKFHEAKRLASEKGFKIGTTGYNSILDCVLRLNKDISFGLQSEAADKVLVDMDSKGVPRNVETFNVLMSHFCKIRKTEEALPLLERMGDWGCTPNATSYLILAWSLYQDGRIGDGDEMIDKIKFDGLDLERKAFYTETIIKMWCKDPETNKSRTLYLLNNLGLPESFTKFIESI